MATASGPVELDVAHTFDRVSTPPFIMSLLADLRTVEQLTPHQCRVIEQCVLDCVSADGRWKAVEPGTLS